MLAEFPSLAELMALAVRAGESATGALERVCRTSQGDLAQEFARILGQTRSGVPLTEALAAFSRRTKIAPLVRFTDGLTVAVERGTPLAGVFTSSSSGCSRSLQTGIDGGSGQKRDRHDDPACLWHFAANRDLCGIPRTSTAKFRFLKKVIQL